MHGISDGWGELRSSVKKDAHRMAHCQNLVVKSFGMVVAVREGARLIARIHGGEAIMKSALKRLAAALGAVMVLALVFLVSGVAQTDTVKYTDAASYYKDAKCVVCHGQKAEKKFNADLKDEEMIEIVLKGKKPEKPPNMPAYEAKGLTAEQAKAMVDYMRSLKQ
jgi:mono/diheme cytochrome c family protein